ncbi:hypothetical protein [Pseudomonas sp. D(2018)]|uniref:hypothetical protein n=1 Tax=Pseudomonas sp. D(2018) TaxID=2502238 RepID=UPI0010F87A03|nr:hypothetical protein [Pseudomonas sp. D(2018)]
MDTLTDLHLFQSDAHPERTLAELYALAFTQAFPDALAQNGCCAWCRSMAVQATQLERFRPACESGAVSVTLRAMAPGEHWVVPVAEGFLTYLAQQTTVRLDEYGIDTTPIVARVAKLAVADDVCLMRFLPPEIFTEAWIMSMIESVPEVVEYVEVEHEVLIRAVEQNTACLRFIPHDKQDVSLYVAAAHYDPEAWYDVLSSMKDTVFETLVEELQNEILDLRAILARERRAGS